MYLCPVEFFLDLMKSFVTNVTSTTQFIESATLGGDCPALDGGQSGHRALPGLLVLEIVAQSSLIFSSENGSCFRRFLPIENIQSSARDFSSRYPHFVLHD